MESPTSDIQRRSGPEASRRIFVHLQRCGKHVSFLHLIFLM